MAAMRQLPLGMRLPDRASFASFEPGANQAVVAQLRAVAQGATREVIWLAGPAGCGKSHLLHALCAAADRVGASYLALDEVAASGPGLLEGRGGRGILCLDALAAVLGNPEWERELFRLWLAAEEQGGSLILAAREPPALLKFALADLGSRMAVANVLQVRPLDEAGQRAALRLRAGIRGLELPDETLQYLQRRFPRDMQTLYQLLDTLDAAALAAQRRITVPFIRDVLAARP